MAEPVIELKDVTKMYGNSRGVIDVSLKVPKGSVFGFLGPNGAGKSTTITMLLDFIRPTSGSIKLFGLDSTDDSLAIHARVGFLAGDMALDRGLTGWQQLEYFGNLRGNFDRDYVRELAKRLDCNLDKKFKTLSRGNKQKVGLIAALMHKPELLILDEPTSGLDPLMQAEFNKIILEHKAAGRTAFISSHMLSEVQEICDSVTFIRGGKLVATKQVHDLTVELPKMFTVTSKDAKLAIELKKLEGVALQHSERGIVIGTYKGDMDKLIKVIAKYKVTDLSLEATDLEAVFMKYYEAENV